MFGAENFHMWVTFAIIFVAIILFTINLIPLEFSASAVIATFLLFFHFFPLEIGNGDTQLNAAKLLAGFANPVLFAILALLIIGQGLFHTGAVEKPAQLLGRMGRSGPTFVFAVTFIVAGTVSAFLNNTPVVVIFIPVVSAIAARLRASASQLLMPLSFICILGGMTTLIGSSPNLIAAAIAESTGVPKIGFFDFFIPGLLLASVGSLYVIFLLPHLLTPRDILVKQAPMASGRHFLAQFVIDDGHPWEGAHAVAGMFPSLNNLTVRVVQRANREIHRPFDELTLQKGDIVSIAATRKELVEILKDEHIVSSISHGRSIAAIVSPPDVRRQPLSMAEAVVAPGARVLGRSIGKTALQSHTRCVPFALQRRSRMVRKPLERIRLEAGDVVLMLGPPEAISGLRENKDLLLLEWSASELPATHHAVRATLIFLATIVAASTGFIPIAIAAIAGALAMIASGCLNVNQALRAIDAKIYFLIGAAFAMSTPLQQTGGASFIANAVVSAFADYGPAALLSALFLLTAVLTNFLSNHATAALIAPIAVNTASQIGVDPAPFIYGVIFALNCSFATPISYQTNLIVMGPGHYRFSDFLRGGIPLIILLWVAYSLFAPHYYGF